MTHINDPYGNLEQAALWLELAGCRKIFFVDSVTGEGIRELTDYLEEEDGGQPWAEKYVRQDAEYWSQQEAGTAWLVK